MNKHFPNFRIFCNNLENDLKTTINVDKIDNIEFKFPIITFGEIIMNKNWHFYVGIEKKTDSTFFYLKCISVSGKEFDSHSVKIKNDDLLESEYDKLFADNYFKILMKPDYGLITSNQI